MIKTFKIFEDWSNVSKITTKLVDQFSQEFIDKFFEDNYMESADEIIDNWPNYIYNNIEDGWLENFIENEINAFGIDDFDEYDYSNFLENELNDDIEKKVLKTYNKKLIKNGKEPKDEYEYYMLDINLDIKLSKKELKKIITDLDLEEDFIKYTINKRYENQDEVDLVNEFFGNRPNSEDLWRFFNGYIDEEGIVSDWLDDQDKTERLKEEIYREKQLQEELLRINKRNAVLLAKLFIEEKDDNIGDTYNFQKAYMKYILHDKKTNIGKSKEDILAEALKFLKDNFGLNNKIAEKYNDYMWIVNTDKYGL